MAMTDALWFATAWVLGTLATLVVMLYRRLGRAERGLSRANGRLVELQHEIERDRLTKLIPVDGGGEPEPPDEDDGRRRLWLVPPVSGIAALVASKIRHTFEVHTATATTVTATVAGLAAASLLWGLSAVVENDEAPNRSNAPSAPRTPGEETIPPGITPTTGPTEPDTSATPSSTSSPTGPADTGPVGEPSPAESSETNEPTSAGDIGNPTPGVDGGSGEMPTDNPLGGGGITGGDQPPPGDDTDGRDGGVDSGTGAGGTPTGGGDPPAEPDEVDGLVCIGLSLPPLLDIDRLCLL